MVKWCRGARRGAPVKHGSAHVACRAWCARGDRRGRARQRREIAWPACGRRSVRDLRASAGLVGPRAAHRPRSAAHSPDVVANAPFRNLRFLFSDPDGVPQGSWSPYVPAEQVSVRWSPVPRVTVEGGECGMASVLDPTVASHLVPAIRNPDQGEKSLKKETPFGHQRGESSGQARTGPDAPTKRGCPTRVTARPRDLQSPAATTSTLRSHHRRDGRQRRGSHRATTRSDRDTVPIATPCQLDPTDHFAIA